MANHHLCYHFPSDRSTHTATARRGWLVIATLSTQRAPVYQQGQHSLPGNTTTVGPGHERTTLCLFDPDRAGEPEAGREDLHIGKSYDRMDASSRQHLGRATGVS